MSGRTTICRNTPSHIMSPTRSQPGSSAEVSLGVRGHTSIPQRAHAPPDATSPHPPPPPLTPTPGQVSSSAASDVSLAPFGLRIIPAMQPSATRGKAAECVAKRSRGATGRGDRGVHKGLVRSGDDLERKAVARDVPGCHGLVPSSGHHSAESSASRISGSVARCCWSSAARALRSVVVLRLLRCAEVPSWSAP